MGEAERMLEELNQQAELLKDAQSKLKEVRSGFDNSWNGIDHDNIDDLAEDGKIKLDNLESERESLVAKVQLAIRAIRLELAIVEAKKELAAAEADVRRQEAARRAAIASRSPHVPSVNYARLNAAKRRLAELQRQLAEVKAQMV